MKTMNRRELLAGASLLPALMNAAPARIRVGMLCIQHSHFAGKVKAMQENPDYEVVAVCEPDEATRTKRGGHAMFNGLKWVQMDELLGDKSLDLIVFEGEVKDAIPYGRRVLEANKHLHLEKPPANKLEPFREIVEIARKRNLRMQLGYLWRFHPGTDLAIEAVKNGWLGEVFMIRATINSDRDMAQRAVEARFAGGSMFELGGHMIDRVVAILGRPGAVRQWLRHDTGIADTVKDNTLAVLEYPKALALIVSSSRDAVSHRTLEVIGTDGSIMIDPMESAITVRIQLREARGPYKKGVQEVKFPAQPRWVTDFEDLARSIKTGTPLKYSYDHELALHETLLRASGEIG